MADSTPFSVDAGVALHAYPDGILTASCAFL